MVIDSPDRRCLRVGEGNAKRASVAWRSSLSSSAWSGIDASREKGEGKEVGARGHMSSSGGGVTMVVGGQMLSVQDQDQDGVWAVVVAVGGGAAEASHSDSAWRDMALRRCLRMRAAAASRADEGKEVFVSEDEEEEEENEEDEVEDMVCGWGENWRVDEGGRGTRTLVWAINDDWQIGNNLEPDHRSFAYH